MPYIHVDFTCCQAVSKVLPPNDAAGASRAARSVGLERLHLHFKISFSLNFPQSNNHLDSVHYTKTFERTIKPFRLSLCGRYCTRGVNDITNITDLRHSLNHNQILPPQQTEPIWLIR